MSTYIFISFSNVPTSSPLKDLQSRTSLPWQMYGWKNMNSPLMPPHFQLERNSTSHHKSHSENSLHSKIELEHLPQQKPLLLSTIMFARINLYGLERWKKKILAFFRWFCTRPFVSQCWNRVVKGLSKWQQGQEKNALLGKVGKSCLLS